MLVTANKFAAAAKNVRVKLLIDQKVQLLACKAGDVVEVPADLARRLIRIDRAVPATLADEKAAGPAEAPVKPVAANR